MITKDKIVKLAEDHKMVMPEIEQSVNQEIAKIDDIGNQKITPELSGVINGETDLYTLSELTTNELNDRLKDEYSAHYFYRNAVNWCLDANYKKAAAFFEKEANTELEHAKGLQNYMTGFNIIPIIPAIEMTKKFQSLPQIIREGYSIELDLMKKYNMSSSKLFNSDITTFDFLNSYRAIQKESVIEYNDLINALSLINEDNKLDVLYFEQTYMN